MSVLKFNLRAVDSPYSTHLVSHAVDTFLAIPNVFSYHGQYLVTLLREERQVDEKKRDFLGRLMRELLNYMSKDLLVNTLEELGFCKIRQLIFPYSKQDFFHGALEAFLFSYVCHLGD